MTQEDQDAKDVEVDEFVLVELKDLRPISGLQAWLEPTDYLSPGNEYMKHIHSHISGTGDWLRSSEIFKSWNGSIQEAAAVGCNCIWVKGVPGSGKSVFSASIAKQLLDAGNIVLFFFFRQIVEKNHDPIYLIRDWLAQLLPDNRWLHQRLDILSKGNTVGKKNLPDLWEIFTEALKHSQKPIYCIADGLDEMDNAYIDFIHELKNIGTDNQLDHVKVLLTSRPIPRIEGILRDRNVASVKLDPTMLYPDITHYVEVRLNSLSPRLSSSKYQEVKEAICERAKGLFLHARLMTDNLTNGLREGAIIEETLPTSLERLPKNLKELYTEMLAEHSRRSGITQEQQFMILQCVIHTSRPLRLIELGSLVMVLRAEIDMSLKESKDLVRQSCGRLLEILEDETVSVIHHSFTEFLRDGERETGDGLFPILDKDKAHAMLVEISLKYLDKCEGIEYVLYDSTDYTDILSGGDGDSDSDDGYFDSWDDLDTGDGRTKESARKTALIQELRLKYPLIDYAINNLDYHVSKASVKDDTSVFLLLDTMFKPSVPEPWGCLTWAYSDPGMIGSPAFYLWMLIKWEQYRPTGVTALHVASFLGWHAYAEHIIANGVSVHQKDEEERTALSYAADKGHTKVAELLLQHGADPESDDRYGLKPLHYATLSDKLGIVQLLLASGVSPVTVKTKDTPENIAEQFSSDIGKTPLEYACQRNRTDIIKAFLPLVDSDWRQKAFGWVNDIKCVEAVLQAGDIAINQINGFKTPLYKAAEKFSVDTIKLLLYHGADPMVRSRVKRDDPYKGWPSADGNTYPDGPTPLHGWAGYERYQTSWGGEEKALDCFKLLVEAGADINAGDKGGWTPLHCACEPKGSIFSRGSSFSNRKDHLVEILLEAGANPNTRTSDGSTPLHLVNRPEVISILVAHGADASIRDKGGHTPLGSFFCSFSDEKKSSTLEKLLEVSATTAIHHRDGGTPVHGIMRGLPRYADPVAFRAISKAGFDLNARDHQGLPPLLTLEKSPWSSGWKEDNFSIETYRKIFGILKDAGMDMNIADSAGRTILHLMIDSHARKLSTLELFLELGCDPLARDHRGATVLHYVVRSISNLSEMMDLFIRHGVDPLTADHDGNTLVHEIVIYSRHTNFSYQEESVPIFLKKLQMLRDLGVPMDSKNRAGQTPLHLSCAIWRQTGWGSRFVDVFLKGEIIPPSDINAVDHKGATPLHYAAVTCEATTKQLLDAGADPQALTYEGLSPLILAARSAQPNIVGLFLQEYKDRGLLDHYVNLRHTAWPHRTALHYACASGRVESIRYLGQAGANPNALDVQGFSPLHALAEFSQDEEDRKWRDRSNGQRATPVLGSLGIALKDPIGEGNPSAMSDVRVEKNVSVSDIIEILVRAGAKLHGVLPESSSKQPPPIDIAAESGNVEMVMELRRRGLSSAYPFREKLWENNRVEADVEELLQMCKETGSSIQQHDRPQRRSRHSTELTVKLKVERLLRNSEYDLLREFVRRSEEVRVEALHVLANRGYVFLLEELLEGLEDVDEKSTFTTEDDARTTTHTLLEAACQSELPNLEVIKVLVEKGQINIDAPFGLSKSDTALSILAKGQYFWNIEALAYLLSQGAQMEGNSKTTSPMSIAAASQSGIWKNEIIKTLLSHGADPNKPTAGGKPPLAYADTVATIRLLLAHGADLTLSGPTALISAVSNLQIDSVKVLLEAGVSPNIPTTPAQDPNMRYLLYDAARIEGPSSTSKATKEKITTLLLNHGADPMLTDKTGSSILQLLIENHGLITPFLTSPAIDWEKPTAGGRTPLLSACYPFTGPTPWPRKPPLTTAFPSLGLRLLKQGVNIHATDSHHRTALHHLSALTIPFDTPAKHLFATLTKKCPDLINARDDSGWTPLHLALRSNQEAAIHTLLLLGADPVVKDPNGRSPLHVLAPRLFSTRSSSEKTAQIIQTLLSTNKIDINARDPQGNTALAIFLSTSKIYISPSESDPYSAYHTPRWSSATHVTHKEYLDLFLDAGADLHATNDKGEGLLHLTAGRTSGEYEDGLKSEIKEVFGELMARGLDGRGEDREGRSAVDVAVGRGNVGILGLFGEGGVGS